MNVVVAFPQAKIAKFECSACGVETSCDCGAKPVPAGTRATIVKALTMNPTGSNRMIAVETGESEPMIRRVRNSLGLSSPNSGASADAPELSGFVDAPEPETRIGLDGKQYPAKRHAKAKEPPYWQTEKFYKHCMAAILETVHVALRPMGKRQRARFIADLKGRLK